MLSSLIVRRTTSSNFRRTLSRRRKLDSISWSPGGDLSRSFASQDDRERVQEVQQRKPRLPLSRQFYMDSGHFTSLGLSGSEKSPIGTLLCAGPSRTTDRISMLKSTFSAASETYLADEPVFTADKPPEYVSLRSYYPLTRQNLYTSTIRTVERESGLSPEFRKTMHAVVRRAYFSTKPPDSSESTATKGTSNTGSTPSPSSSSSSSSFSTSASPSDDSKKSFLEKSKDMVVSTTTTVIKAIVNFFVKLPGVMWYYLTHPSELRNRLVELKEAAKKEAHHYWMGSKLLVADVRTAYKLLQRTLQGSSLTRRERKQLLRTVSDLFRLVPFSMFVLIPFMEFALPLALRIFPNMLPSTFQDSLKAEESMKRELKTRIAMAQFFQDTLQNLVKEQKKQAESLKQKKVESHDTDGQKEAAKQEQSALKMLEFLERARSGETLPSDVIIQYATYFQDDMTLDNMPRMQLINMCTYMNIPPYGADSFLRFQLRFRIRTLREDDQRILWEGIDSLTKMELREACRERGMRSTGLSKDAYKRALQQWLDLSVNKNVPISLLIMSRTFFLREEMTTRPSPEGDDSKSLAGLADAISGLDKDVVNEAVLEVATSEEKQSDPDVMRIRLEVLEHQNERIRQEQEARDAASKLKKEHLEKERAEAEAKAEESPAAAVSDEAKSEEHVEVLSGVEPPKEERGETKAESTKIDEVVKETAAEGTREEEIELSTQEMEALSQLISPDAVSNEREQLERIKAAMKEGDGLQDAVARVKAEDKERETAPDDVGEALPTKATSEKKEDSVEPMGSDEADRYAAEIISKMDKAAEGQSLAATKDTLGEALAAQVLEDDALTAKVLEEEPARANRSLDKAISRLKSKVESMVDKIENQLTDVQLKIGEKLHFLDKDMDGILSREEMALCLQQVLKRDLSFEEAMEIAEEMDEDKDGVFTVAEFIRWVETNKLVKYVEEGRDADLDRSFQKSPPKDSTPKGSTMTEEETKA